MNKNKTSAGGVRISDVSVSINLFLNLSNVRIMYVVSKIPTRPAKETYHNAQLQKYQIRSKHLHLPSTSLMTAQS